MWQLNDAEYIKWSIEQVLVYKACKELSMHVHSWWTEEISWIIA